MSFFSASSICAGYGKKNILSDVSFSAEKGKLMGVLGANGCGKTTLLKCLCGILPHEGECTLLGERLEGLSSREIAKKCSYIPQRSGISIEISALDVVLMGFNPNLGLLQHPGKKMRTAAKETLELVGLGGREDDDYLSLSEGQKQLCILARTLVSDANLLLLDEPLTSLDVVVAEEMKELLRSLKDNRITIFSTHLLDLALDLCDEIVLLSHGELQIVGKADLNNAEFKDKIIAALREDGNV